MKKTFVKINFYKDEWSDKIREWVCYGDAKTTILDMDSIVKISGDPLERKHFKETRDISYGTPDKTVKIYTLTTNIAYGRGINGVDFVSFSVEEKVAHALLAHFEILDLTK